LKSIFEKGILSPMRTERIGLVTGASGGLGREIAVALAGEAGTVLVHYFRHLRAAEETVRRIQAAGAESGLLQADISREAGARGFIRAAEKKWGRIDILVNNVGPILFKPWDRLSAVDWEKMWRGNLWSAYACLAAALPGMRIRRFGRIVNIGFGRAEQLAGFPSILPYAVAKTGLLVLTRTAAAAEQGTGVTINMVSPGLLKEGVLPAGRRIPLAALGTYADVAEAVRFLVSDKARRVTGTNLLVAGTWKM
jgi:3-oxoacyl-[acyl-carrier protein] reductase